MPLNKAQIEVIEGSINHLLDFSEKEEAFTKEIADLNKSFAEPNLNINDYHHLVCILLNPEQGFYQLEKLNSTGNLFVAEVQDFIIDKINTALINTSKNNGVSLLQHGWNVDTIRKRIISLANRCKKFTGQPMRVENTPLPWQVITDEGKIFSAALSRNSTANIISLKIDIALPSGMQSMVNLDFYRIDRYFSSEEMLLTNLIKPAKIIAYIHASNKVIELFCKKGIATYQEAYVSPKPLRFNEVITDQFYIDKLISQQINFKQILSLTLDEITNLLNPTVKNLLGNNIISFQKACKLTKTEVTLAYCYLDILLKKQLCMSHLSSVADDRINILILPLIVNLVKSGKLSFNMAKQLPCVLRELLLHPLYTEYFLKNKIDWGSLVIFTARECNFLLDKNHAPALASLIKEKILNLNMILILPDDILERFKNLAILKLLLDRDISVVDLMLFSNQTMRFINQNQNINTGLVNKIITLRDLETLEPLQLYVKVYAARLLAANKGTSFVFNGRIDSNHSIKDELPAVAFSIGVEPIELEILILEKYAVQRQAFINPDEADKFQAKLQEILNINRYLKESSLSHANNSFHLLSYRTRKNKDMPRVANKLTKRL